MNIDTTLTEWVNDYRVGRFIVPNTINKTTNTQQYKRENLEEYLKMKASEIISKTELQLNPEPPKPVEQTLGNQVHSLEISVKENENLITKLSVLSHDLKAGGTPRIEVRGTGIVHLPQKYVARIQRILKDYQADCAKAYDEEQATLAKIKKLV